MDSVQDPLRFGVTNANDDFTEEISLHDEPPAPAAAPAPSPAQPTPARAAAVVDPLRSPSPASASPDQRPKFTGSLGRRTSSSGVDPSPSDPLSARAKAAAGSTSARFNGASVPEDLEIRQASDDTGYMRNAAADAAGPSRRSGPRLNVTVTDPVKRFADHAFIPGITSSHYEYLVASAPAEDRAAASGSPAQPARAQVRRRFNDFVALGDLLEETHRGYFIFPRPDKGALEGAAAGRSDAEFVESRRAELERYLRRLAAHPVLGGSEELSVFLRAEGALASAFQWQQLQPLRGSLLEGVARLPRQLLGDGATPSTTEAAKNARHTNDLLRRLREMGERVRQEYASAPPALPEEEVKLREARAGVESYADAVAAASRKAERLVREFERVGAATGDLGLALIRLAKYEDEEGGRAAGPYTAFGAAAKGVAGDARRVGMAAVRMSRLARSATVEAVGALEPLHTELALAPAVTAALREREAAMLTAHSMGEHVGRRRAALAAVEDGPSSGGGGGDPAKARARAAALRNEIAAAEAALEAAQGEYGRVRGRNESELARWRGESAAEFQRMTRGFAQVAALFEERASQVWRGAEEDLSGGGAGAEGA